MESWLATSGAPNGAARTALGLGAGLGQLPYGWADAVRCCLPYGLRLSWAQGQG